MNILKGYVVREKRTSLINGELTVIDDLFMGTYIKGGGLPQSGGLAKKIWKTTINLVKGAGLWPKKCLILGFGGGGIAELIAKSWPGAGIVGVDIDSVIVELGKKYLNYEKYTKDIHIEDAQEFVEKCIKNKNKYDLICVDTYVGDEFPKKFSSEQFIESVKSILSPEGVAVFNRLYGQEDKKEAKLFGSKLESNFPNVEKIYPEANIMFVCRQS